MFSCHEACTVVTTSSVAAHCFLVLFLYVVVILYFALMLGAASIDNGEVLMLFKLSNKTIAGYKRIAYNVKCKCNAKNSMLNSATVDSSYVSDSMVDALCYV